MKSIQAIEQSTVREIFIGTVLESDNGLLSLYGNDSSLYRIYITPSAIDFDPLNELVRYYIDDRNTHYVEFQDKGIRFVYGHQ